jgi:hypothetical protein
VTAFAWSFAYRFRSFRATPKVQWLIPAGRDKELPIHRRE